MKGTEDMKAEDVDDQIMLIANSPLVEERELVMQVLLNYASGTWDLWLGPEDKVAFVVTRGRRRVKLSRDGTFTVLEKKVPLRRRRLEQPGRT
jgi:hypothetical protein